LVGPIPASQNNPIEVPPVQVDAHEEEEVNNESSLADPPPEYGAVQGNVGDVLLGFINMAKNVVQHPGLSDFAKREIRACITRLEGRDTPVHNELCCSLSVLPHIVTVTLAIGNGGW
jgi:hypothetical protein